MIRCYHGLATGVLLLLTSVIMNDKVQAAVSKPSQGSTAIDFKALRERERQKMIREMLANKEKDDYKPLLQDKRPLDLASYAIKDAGAPSGVYLIPDWLTEDEAMDLEDAIDSAPGYLWASLTRRRLQNLGGIPNSSGMRPVDVPRYASEVMQALVNAGVFPADQAPNHILLNEYRDGQGIGPHKDGPLYHPMVAVLSLGSPADIHFCPRADGLEPVCIVPLPHASLLIFTGEAYEKFWHTIPASHDASRRGERRLSLTVRRVVCVLDGEREVLETAEQRGEEERREKRFLYSITDHRPGLQQRDKTGGQ